MIHLKQMLAYGMKVPRALKVANRIDLWKQMREEQAGRPPKKGV
jgi:hypothetical protein